MAAGFRDEAKVTTTDMSIGHCHAADPLITLASLQERGDLDDGDHVLVVATGGRAWTAAALRYQAS
jgi:3-oxoacyl-[acyl-carrier-protein] synthase III